MSSQSNPTTRHAGATRYDVEAIRKDFPIIHQRIHGKPLVYLDNAATSQKPQIVIDSLERHYATDNSNVHRGVHTLSVRATKAYEETRTRTAKFIGAPDPREIIFVRGTTEGINLIAQTFAKMRVGPRDQVVISEMEHHSNIVPWQLMCEEKGARLRVIPMNDAGELLLDEYEKLLTPRTKIVSVVHVSNSLGTINPIERMIEMAHAKDIPVVIDGAQATPHMRVNVKALDCDFFVFSSHKMYGPTGVGVVYGKLGHLQAMPPYQGGGDMIESVTFEKTTYNKIPHKFEAGTPNVADVVAFAATIDYLEKIGYDGIQAHERDLVEYATAGLSAIDGVRIIGTAKQKTGVVSFVLEGVHPHDVGTILDREGIAIRTGHHCTQPVMQHYDLPATSRASFGIYNTKEEIDTLVASVRKVKEVFE